MQANFNLKDLIDISSKVDICNVGSNFIVSAYTNTLGGEINAFIRIDNSENDTLGRTVLFSVRSGEQISLSDLSYDEQLIIPQEALDKIKNSMSVKFELFGNSSSVWQLAITKINSKHNDDSNNNFERLADDLPVPDFRYVHVEKEKKSFFSKIKDIIKK